MDFTLPEDIDTVRLKIRKFVDEHVIPLESDRSVYDHHENIADAKLKELRALAKAEGLWTLQMPEERGGGGMKTVGMAAC